MTEKVSDNIKQFVLEQVSLPGIPRKYPSDPFWKELKNTGTELWLDTGDIDAAGSLWCSEFSGLTTNNTLLNIEVQRGIYDELIEKAGGLLKGLDLKEKVVEIAFILNAVHGHNLVRRFGARVSVELHTDFASDVERTVYYARQFHSIEPENFIIKVPLSPEGFIATRRLREEGIPVNFTLGFSARHNYLATLFSSPSYVNVFLGRLNSYIADNRLGDGLMVGEKATLASQRWVSNLSKEKGRITKQIAASMRQASQLRDLAGVDVFTMPVKVTESAKKELSGEWKSQLDSEYEVMLYDGVKDEVVRLSKLWDITEKEKLYARELEVNPPSSGGKLIEMAHDSGIHDLFPRLNEEESGYIASDGKIPLHKRWESRIKKGEAAIDSLLNLAGLASFAESQRELDERIEKLIG
ncbi:MAG: transaldolase family protein [Spirochaetota bacterium]